MTNPPVPNLPRSSTPDLRDLAVQRVDARAGHAVEFCHPYCTEHGGYDEETLLLIEGREYVTPSGRRWRASLGRTYRVEGKVLMTPLGTDTYGFGGVKAMRVDPERLEGYDRTWKPTTRWRGGL